MQLLVNPVVEAQHGERMALRHTGEGDQSLLLRMRADELEVDSGGDVGGARPVEEISDRPVIAIAVRWAARLAHPAVVDQERVARVGEPGCDLLDGCERALGEQGFLTVSEGDDVAGRWLAEVFDEPIPIEPDHDLLRPGGRSAETAEREVVHQFVGQDQLRGPFHSLRDLDPFDRIERPPGPRARLDGCVGHVEIPKVLDQLSRERAVSRPDFCHAEGPGLAESAVQVDDRAPQQLGEHGVDVRARDEMTVGTDRWVFEEASGTEERELHVFGERDRAVVPDRARDGVAHIHGLQGTGSRIASDPVSEEIRQAASLIGVRDGSDGPEVLVIERTLDHRFLPGYIAFPGGAVDAADASLAERWFGNSDEASRAAAIRELVEEVGLAVTRETVVGADRDRPLARIHDDPPPPTRLPEVARWIAPERVPVRFDARYYAARMDGAADPMPDGVEAAKAWWASPRELMRAWESGELLLYWPTHFTMSALANCRDADELLGLQITTREPDDDELERLPRSVFYQD